MWFDPAVANGDDLVRPKRDSLVAKMTAEQIAEAQRLGA